MNEGPDMASSRRAHFIALGLSLLTALLYAPSLGFDFIQLDTRTILLEHPELYDETSLLQSLVGIFTIFPREEPLIVRDFVWAIEARVFGLHNPLGHHVGNVLLNSACTAIAFYLLLLTTRRLALATCAAAWFSVLTVHVQPVCWAMGTKDLLVFAFMGLALIVQHASLRHEGTPRGRLMLLCVLVLHMLAILSKFSAVFFFLVLALHRALAPYLDGSTRPDAPLDMKLALRRALPVLLGGLVISAVLFAWYNANLSQFGVLKGRGPATLSAEHLHKLSQFVPWVLALNLKTIFWPFQYSIMYQHPNANIPLTGAELATGYATLVALTGLVVSFLRKRKDLAFYALTAGVLLLPYLNIQYIGYWVADRYMYGIALLAVTILVQLGLELSERRPQLKRPLVAAFAILLVAYAARTLQYQAEWRDELTLYRHETSLDRPSVFAWEARAKEAWRLGLQSQAPAERASFLQEAHDASERGLALYERLAIPLSSYRASERLYASRLLIVLGDLAALRGEPLPARLPYYERAYALAVSAKSALVLAQAYIELAGQAPADAREALVRKSFSYFGDYARQVQTDPSKRRHTEAMLSRNYEQRFPFLAAEAAALRAQHMP